MDQRRILCTQTGKLPPSHVFAKGLMYYADTSDFDYRRGTWESAGKERERGEVSESRGKKHFLSLPLSSLLMAGQVTLFLDLR